MHACMRAGREGDTIRVQQPGAESKQEIVIQKVTSRIRQPAYQAQDDTTVSLLNKSMRMLSHT